MTLIIINSKLRGAEQDSVPYMMKVIPNHIPTECGVVDPYVYRFLNPFTHTGKYQMCGVNSTRYLNSTCKLTL